MENNYKENCRNLLESFSEFNSGNNSKLSLENYLEKELNYSRKESQEIVKNISAE